MSSTIDLKMKQCDMTLFQQQKRKNMHEQPYHSGQYGTSSVTTDRKNKISSQWPNYMIKQYTSCKDLRDDPKQRSNSKEQNSANKMGMSSDNLMVTKFSQAHPTSASIFGKHNLSQENLKDNKAASGLGFSNSHHKFYCHNGHKDKPKIFANFIRNTNMQQSKLRAKNIKSQKFISQYVKKDDNYATLQQKNLQNQRQKVKSIFQERNSRTIETDAKPDFKSGAGLRAQNQSFDAKTQEQEFTFRENDIVSKQNTLQMKGNFKSLSSQAAILKSERERKATLQTERETSKLTHNNYINIMSSQTDRISIEQRPNQLTKTGTIVSNKQGYFNPCDPYENTNDDSLLFEEIAMKRKEEMDRTVRTVTTANTNVFDGYARQYQNSARPQSATNTSSNGNIRRKLKKRVQSANKASNLKLKQKTRYESSIDSQMNSVVELRKSLIKQGIPLDDLYKTDLVEMNYNIVKTQMHNLNQRRLQMQTQRSSVFKKMQATIQSTPIPVNRLTGNSSFERLPSNSNTFTSFNKTNQMSGGNRSNVHPKFYNKYQALLNQEKVIDVKRSYDNGEILNELKSRRSSQQVFDDKNEVSGRGTSLSFQRGITPSISFDLTNNNEGRETSQPKINDRKTYKFKQAENRIKSAKRMLNEHDFRNKENLVGILKNQSARDFNKTNQ